MGSGASLPAGAAVQSTTSSSFSVWGLQLHWVLCAKFLWGPLHSGGVPRWLLFFLEGHRPPPVTSFNLSCLLKTLTLGLGLRCAALGQRSVCVACAAFTAGSLHLPYLEHHPCGTGLCHSAMSSAHCRDRPLYPRDPPVCGGPPRAPTLRASAWALPGSAAAELWVDTHGEPPQS